MNDYSTVGVFLMATKTLSSLSQTAQTVENKKWYEFDQVLMIITSGSFTMNYVASQMILCVILFLTIIGIILYQGLLFDQSRGDFWREPMP